MSFFASCLFIVSIHSLSPSLSLRYTPHMKRASSSQALSIHAYQYTRPLCGSSSSFQSHLVFRRETSLRMYVYVCVSSTQEREIFCCATLSLSCWILSNSFALCCWILRKSFALCCWILSNSFALCCWILRKSSLSRAGF